MIQTTPKFSGLKQQPLDSPAEKGSVRSRKSESQLSFFKKELLGSNFAQRQSEN